MSGFRFAVWGFGFAVQAHRLCVSLNSRLESNKEEEKIWCLVLEASDAGFEVCFLGHRS